ncbi:MAG: ASCH domain-containing protein [Candidatus Caldarchaeum sp.]
MRRVITFKPEMLDLVVKGLKTSTVRPVNGSVYSDDLVLTDGVRRVYAKLLSVRRLRLAEAANHYVMEGFSSPDEFIENIRRIYPSLGPNDEVNLIEFKLQPTDASATIPHPNLQRTRT